LFSRDIDYLSGWKHPLPQNQKKKNRREPGPKKMDRHFTPLLVVGIVLFSMAGTSAQAQIEAQTQAPDEISRPLTFGVVPQQSATKLAEMWVPLLRLLSEKTHRDIKFATAKDIPTFEKRLSEGAYDFVYMNPLHYDIYSRKHGFVAFAKEQDKQIRGVVVVRKDSPYAKLEDLEGENLAFPSPLAFASSVLPRTQFDHEKINVTPNYVGSHDSVYRAVAKGLFAGGGGIERTLASINENIRSQLRTIWTSKGYAPHAFAAHPRVPNAVVHSLQFALTHIWLDPPGNDALAAANLGTIGPARDADWKNVHELCETIPIMLEREGR